MTELQDLSEWEFFRGEKLQKKAVNYQDLSKQWQKVKIPHSWNTKDVQEGGGKLLSMLFPKGNQGYVRSPHWYRKVLHMPIDLKEKRIFVHFGAVGTVADVYLNDQHVGQHQGGFSAFCYELTPFLKFGEANVLAVKADNTHRRNLPPHSGDFPLMGGIYRPVKLIIKNKICINPLDYASSGVYITQKDVTHKNATIQIKTLLSMERSAKSLLNLRVSIYNAQENLVVTKKDKIEALKDVKTLNLNIENPHLWNGRKDPYLYSVHVELLEGDNVIDKQIEPLGIRFYHIDPESGFYLNGESYRIYGVSRHQDRHDVGWALTKEHQDEDAQLISEMGARGVRLAHYQHSEYFYSLCDQKGLLVWAEIAIVNKVRFNKKFFHNAKTMLLELIKQNYNHPSIVMWGLCNEIGAFQIRSPHRVIRKLNAIAKEVDPTRLTTLAAIALGKFRKKLYQITDVFATNIYPGWYGGKAENIYDLMNEWNQIGHKRGLALSEYGAGGSIYHHEIDPDNIRAMGIWHPEEKQAQVHEIDFKAITETPYIWGSFVWNMFDFSSQIRNEGDNPGRNDKGLVTFDRKTRKDAYFFYQANLSDEPMVHITSTRFTQRSTSIVPIKVYSNCQDVQLWVNGKDMGLMKSSEMNIFRSEIALKGGLNIIKVLAHTEDTSLEDQCEWRLIQ